MSDYMTGRDSDDAESVAKDLMKLPSHERYQRLSAMWPRHRDRIIPYLTRMLAEQGR